MSLLSEFLGLKNINFNLYELFYGTRQNKIKLGYEESLPYKLNDKYKNKLYNAMDSSDKPDKGKGVDKGDYTSFDESKELVSSTVSTNSNLPYSNQDPSYLFTKHTNPGPGFNVPGSKVPILDPICQHIDYNGHYLSQFRNMSLETALEQRGAYYAQISGLNRQLYYAKDSLSKISEVPKDNNEIQLRKTLERDILFITQNKIRMEGRIILLDSRIEFINIALRKK